MRNKYQNFEQDSSKYRTPFKKESFQFVTRIVEDLKPTTLLDIGCASGDFVCGLSDSIKAIGIDQSAELISIAKGRSTENKNFLEIDVLNNDQEELNKILENNAEVITILGTLHAFNDFRPLLDKTILNKNTQKIIIHSPFNDSPVDVQVFHRDLTRREKSFQSAYNIFAKRTIADYLRTQGVSDFMFIPFVMRESLHKNPQYPLRNYHLLTRDGDKYITNGLGLLLTEYMLVINL